MALQPQSIFGHGDPTELSTRPIDEARPIKVIVIGGGLSGLLSAIYFPRAIENLELVIYEKNPDLGGTWYENRYPGVACDIPSHVYQLSFENNSQWSNYYAPGPEIHAYLKRVAEKYDATKFFKFNTKAVGARWNDEEGKWHVQLEDMASGKVFEDCAEILCSATGILNIWKWPDIEGLTNFKGQLYHSANYDPSANLSGKRVALIGGGSTGIQILPQIQKTAFHVDHYMKGRTWIPPAGIGGEVLMRSGGDPITKAEDLETWAENPKSYIEYRKKIEETLHRPAPTMIRDTPAAAWLLKICENHMKTKLAKKPEIFDQLRPDFPVACRRLTPGPGYLEALVEDNVDFISTKITKCHDTGIETADGKIREVDIIICATGFDGVYKQHYPVYGKNGVNLQNVWSELPEAYMAIAPQDMPNYFCFLGPNGGPGLGSAIPMLEFEGKYITKVIQKIQREWIKSMVPKPDAIKDFGLYADRFFKPTVFMASCNAWWKANGDPKGRLLAIYPGSQLHADFAFANPRWEDYEYEYRSELQGNRLGWLGNGYSKWQFLNVNTTSHLDTAYVPVENPITKLAELREEAIKMLAHAPKAPYEITENDAKREPERIVQTQP